MNYRSSMGCKLLDSMVFCSLNLAIFFMAWIKCFSDFNISGQHLIGC